MASPASFTVTQVYWPNNRTPVYTLSPLSAPAVAQHPSQKSHVQSTGGDTTGGVGGGEGGTTPHHADFCEPVHSYSKCCSFLGSQMQVSQLCFEPLVPFRAHPQYLQGSRTKSATCAWRRRAVKAAMRECGVVKRVSMENKIKLSNGRIERR